MTIKFTVPFNLPYPDVDDPVRNGQSAIEGIAKGVNTALQNANIPPGNPNLNAVLARLNALESYQPARTNALLAPGVSNLVPGELAMANRAGGLVTLQARVNRNTAGSISLMTLPSGFRPSRQVHVWAIKAATTSALLQVDALGAVVTPFDTTASEFMIAVTFSVS
ncbi:hypothetical protein [Arthrobacter alpinus]|uniref:hypothetical protein n=1 Tax=Arthrobacter alpinus TaxID=656366 RepID=UPI001647B567|nr:hypothetical protein [Arthrobacter alpinus]